MWNLKKTKKQYEKKYLTKFLWMESYQIFELENDNYDKNVLPFLDHLFTKIDSHKADGWRILILTLTKKSAEEITNFLLSKWYKTYYLHSEIETLKRREIINKLRSGQIDILVWINLLREWIDIPEVSLIAILDADKEGFLRSTTSLIQIIGRAARNPKGEVILYADSFTDSIILSIEETYRRRDKQENHNLEHNITPTQAISNIKSIDIVKSDDNLGQDFIKLQKWNTDKKLKRMTNKEKEIILKDLRLQLEDYIKSWEFEKAAIVRDQIKELSWE